MGKGSEIAEYSIAAVSKLTGVSCHALRVWERRYQFPIPRRSSSGHRRYTSDQVGLLRNLAGLAGSGRPIGELIGEYKAGRLAFAATPAVNSSERPVTAVIVDHLLDGNLAEAEIILDRLAGELSPIEMVQRVIEPALIDAGERWYRKECEIFQERHATGVLHNRLTRILDQARRSNTHPHRTALVGAVEGDRHEGGILMVSLALELAGWRAVPLGPDLPVVEYGKAVKAWHPDAVGLSFVLSRNINKRFRELAQIKGVPIIVGGRSIVNHQGLARRHGLIPLTGSLSAATARMIREVEAWEKERAGPAGNAK